MIRKILIDFVQRLLRASLVRLAEDVELMQSIAIGYGSAVFALREFSTASPVRSRDLLLKRALEDAPKDGLVCEFGVYKGESLRVLSASAATRTVHGFDSFDGLPERWRLGFDAGAFRLSSNELPKLAENVTLHVGLFDATLPEFLDQNHEKAALIHIDCDLYSSTKCVLDLLASRLQAGSIIVFDEYYNFPGWQEDEHKALVEASREHGFSYRYLFYNPRGQQVAIVITGTAIAGNQS